MSKHIVITGGGSPGKFGNDFALKARSEGHRVTIFSHRDYNTNHPDDHVLDYFNYEKSKQTLQQVKENLGPIDVLYFNHNGGCFPYKDEELLSEPDIFRYNISLHSAVCIPHLMVVLFNDNLVDGARVVFTSSTIMYELHYPKGASGVGYAGQRAWATYLMRGFANTRTRNITYSGLSPYINYDDRQHYANTLIKTYDHVLNHDDSFNGCIAHLHAGNRGWGKIIINGTLT